MSIDPSNPDVARVLHTLVHLDERNEALAKQIGFLRAQLASITQEHQQSMQANAAIKEENKALVGRVDANSQQLELSRKENELLVKMMKEEEERVRKLAEERERERKLLQESQDRIQARADRQSCRGDFC